MATWAPRRNDACRPDGSVQVRQTSSPAQSCDMNERTAKEVVEEMYRRQHSGDPTVLDDLVAELSGESCSGTSRTVSAGAAADAVRACGAHRLVLVHPPWFDEEIDRMGVGYFRDQGFDVTLLKATGLSRDPSRVILRASPTGSVDTWVTVTRPCSWLGTAFEPLGQYRSWSNEQVGWFFRRTRYCCGRSLPPRTRH